MLKCRISLDAFAWELDEELVAQAKSFFTEGHISDLDNIGQGVWSLLVEDEGEEYEVELLIKGRIFQKIGCECATFGGGEVCPHIVSGFYALAEKMPKKKLRNKPQTSLPLAKRKVVDFMQMLPEDRLEDLVLGFARKNRRFALLIRAGATPYAENEPDKYKQLLYLVIRHASVNKKISVSGLNFVNEVVHTVLAELKAQLNEGNTAETKLFAEAYLKTWPILKNYELPDKKKPYTSLYQTLQLLENAISIIVAPQLLEEIVVMLAGFVPIYARLSPPVNHKLLEMVRKMAMDAYLQNQCAPSMAVLIGQQLPLAELKDTLELLVEWGRPPAELVSAISESWVEDEYRQFCQLAIDKGHFKLLEALVAVFQSQANSPQFEQELEDYQLLIAESNGDRKRVISLAEKSFKQTGKVKYFKILKDRYGKKWPKEARRLFKYFSGAQKPLPAALLLVDMEAWDQLLPFVTNQDDLLLLAKVDKYLFIHKELETKALYKKLLANYFDQHLGDKPLSVYQFVQDHLKAIGYSAFGKEINGWMRKRYGHRTLLKTAF